MPRKTKIELQTELPILIKSKGLVSPTKTTGDSLRSMLLDIIDSMGYSGEGVPEGGIIEWYGSIATIPQFWVLCDGRYGTPDLRDKFVIGAGSTYSPGDTGGSAIHNHSGSIGGHALTINEMPSHSHTIRAYVQSGSNDGSGGEAAGYFEDRETQSIGGGQEHTHSLNLSSEATLPPYRALAFIMYKGVNFTLDSTVPSQVMNLLANSQTHESFNLSWDQSTDNVGVVGYDIYLNGIYTNSTSNLYYSFSGLNPSTNYTVIVKARDYTGNVSSDSSLLVTTLAAPIIVTPPSGTNVSLNYFLNLQGGYPGTGSFGIWSNGVMIFSTESTDNGILSVPINSNIEIYLTAPSGDSGNYFYSEIYASDIYGTQTSSGPGTNQISSFIDFIATTDYDITASAYTSSGGAGGGVEIT